MSVDVPPEKIVEVYVSHRPGCLKMSLERAHERFVKGFFPNISSDDVWTAAQGQSGWQGTISGMFVSIFKAGRIRDSDVVIR